MIFKTIPLREDAPDVVLDAYIADPYRKKRKALLILPGGAYRHVCADREGEPVALAFMPHGFNAFVLHYSVNRKRVFPAPLIEAAMAIKHIKDNAEEYGIDPEELFVVGFSAGGHLAACCGVLWKHPAIYEALDMPYGYNKPKGVMPIYPVIHGHAASFQNMWCTDTPTQEQKEQVYVDLHVDADSVPAFCWHTFTDPIVPVENSLALAQAYNKAHVPFELHIYPKGPHGMSLANALTDPDDNGDHQNKEIAKWVEMAVAWANQL